ncbi:hypothetical protein GQR60_14655 [Labilibaculum sp. A4]|uniref:hypothetical protein n=1 Tax=Labilibaculum euxinus TaxID=2686357 RepID=UPI000F61F587|nr:hypothetical protein [Labilibaculum euxinus]MDQ1770208.1 hypothetical protein [Labilibaculum euxinus]MWN77578.1 hypothetical protein [Labilibaculum euxinus]
MMNLLILLLSFTSIQEKAVTKEYQFIGCGQYTYNEEGLCSGKLSFDSPKRLKKKVLYFYDEQGNKIKTEKYNVTNKLITVYEYQFNEKKQKTKSSKIDHLKNKVSSKRYTYDDKGRNIKTEYYSNKTLLKTVKYAFNEFGHQIESTTYNAEGKQTSLFYTENKYDKNGRLSEKYTRDTNGKLVKLNHYDYNKESQRSTSFTYYHSGKRPNSKRIYEYDSNGRKVGFIKYIVIE